MSEWSTLSLNEGVFDGETFCTYTLTQSQVVAESWLCHFKAVRSYGPLGYKPPAPELPVPIMITRAVLATQTNVVVRAGIAANHGVTISEYLRRPIIRHRKASCSFERIGSHVAHVSNEAASDIHGLLLSPKRLNEATRSHLQVRTADEAFVLFSVTTLGISGGQL